MRKARGRLCVTGDKASRGGKIRKKELCVKEVAFDTGQLSVCSFFCPVKALKKR